MYPRDLCDEGLILSAAMFMTEGLCPHQWFSPLWTHSWMDSLEGGGDCRGGGLLGGIRLLGPVLMVLYCP
jgi:hypothetical protein